MTNSWKRVNAVLQHIILTRMSVSIQSTVNINNNCLPQKASQPAATEGNAKAEKSAGNT